MRPFCPICSRKYNFISKYSPVVPPCGHARCYDCARKGWRRACSSVCTEVIKPESVAYVTVEYIDLNDANWAAKLESTRNTSLRLDKISLEDTFSLLEEERSEVAQCLQGFCLGSTLQTAVETLVLEIDEVEESKILSEIATETRRLEELELKIQAAESHLEWRKTAVN